MTCYIFIDGALGHADDTDATMHDAEALNDALIEWAEAHGYQFGGSVWVAEDEDE